MCSLALSNHCFFQDACPYMFWSPFGQLFRWWPVRLMYLNTASHLHSRYWRFEEKKLKPQSFNSDPICAGHLIWHRSSPPCRNQASSLAFLIAQMQKNADQVEKDILRSEELLAVVRIRWKGHTNRCFTGRLSHCRLLSTGCWEWKERPPAPASNWDFRQAGWGWRPAEGPFPGCWQSQEAQTPSGHRDRERVSGRR